jgi:hypothetical protein
LNIIGQCRRPLVARDGTLHAACHGRANHWSATLGQVTQGCLGLHRANRSLL